MNRLARIAFASLIGLAGWFAAPSPARAAFTITTTFNSGSSTLAVTPSSGASDGSYTLGSMTTNVGGTTAGMMNFNLAA